MDSSFIQEMKTESSYKCRDPHHCVDTSIHYSKFFSQLKRTNVENAINRILANIMFCVCVCVETANKHRGQSWISVIITFIIVFCPRFHSLIEKRFIRKKKGKRNGKTKYVVFLWVFFEFTYSWWIRMHIHSKNGNMNLWPLCIVLFNEIEKNFRSRIYLSR